MFAPAALCALLVYTRFHNIYSKGLGIRFSRVVRNSRCAIMYDEINESHTELGNSLFSYDLLPNHFKIIAFVTISVIGSIYYSLLIFFIHIKLAICSKYPFRLIVLYLGKTVINQMNVHTYITSIRIYSMKKI